MKVGVSSWFGNVTEFEERTRSGSFSDPYPYEDADQFRKELAVVDLVEPLGFDSFWTIEHHFSPYGMTANPTQILSYVAGRTKRIDVGTMVLVLPWHEPLKLAENLAILDILLDGRKINIGVGRGFAAREYHAFGIPYETSRERMVECLEIVRLALTQEFFSFEGEHFQIPRTSIRPRPLSRDLTENFLMTWASPDSLAMAANSGTSPLFTNYRGWDMLREQLGEFNDIRTSHGWAPSSTTIATTVYVHEGDAHAKEVGEQYWRKTSATTSWHYDKFGSDFFMPDGSDADRAAAVQKGYEDQSSAGIFGSPASVIEQIRELQSVADVGHLITLLSFGDMPLEMVEESMRLFAAKVLPTIQTFGNGIEPFAVPYDQVVADRSATPAGIAE